MQISKPRHKVYNDGIAACHLIPAGLSGALTGHTYVCGYT